MYDTKNLAKLIPMIKKATLVGKVELPEGHYEVVQVLIIDFKAPRTEDQVKDHILDYDNEGIISVSAHPENRMNTSWVVVVHNTY